MLMTAMPGWRHCVSANVDVFTPVARDCVRVWPVPGLQVGVNTCGQIRSNRVNLAHIASVFPFSCSFRCPVGNSSHSGSPQGVKRWLYRTLLGIVYNLLGSGLV